VIPPRVSINGVALENDQAIALAMAVNIALTELNKKDSYWRARSKGMADEMAFDLMAVTAMLDRSLAA
jgi:hypothetical protein